MLGDAKEFWVDRAAIGVSVWQHVVVWVRIDVGGIGVVCLVVVCVMIDVEEIGFVCFVVVWVMIHMREIGVVRLVVVWVKIHIGGHGIVCQREEVDEVSGAFLLVFIPASQWGRDEREKKEDGAKLPSGDDGDEH